MLRRARSARPVPPGARPPDLLLAPPLPGWNRPKASNSSVTRMDGPGGIGMGGFFAGPSGEWGGVWMVKQCLKSDKVSKGLNRLQNIYIYTCVLFVFCPVKCGRSGPCLPICCWGCRFPGSWARARRVQRVAEPSLTHHASLGWRRCAKSWKHLPWEPKLSNSGSRGQRSTSFDHSMVS